MLHLDKNDFYGGAEAALSLEEAEAWTASINGGGSCFYFPFILGANLSGSRNSPFRGAAVQRLEQDASRPTTLGFSRAYSLSLSPQLIYTRSNLLPALVSSKVYRQLEFLAVGSWWIYGSGSNTQGAAQEPNTLAAQDYLRKIPSSREDVVNDTSIDLRSKRNIMRFLQLAADAEAFIPMIEEQGSLPFPEFLSSQFKIPDRLHAPLLGLTLSPDLPKHTSTAYAIPRIQRHLTSTGMFGPGFAAVIPKWGGLAEVTQVACRAGAVGGGVYVLNKAIEEIGDPGINQEERKSQEAETTIKLRLVGDETIQAKRVAGSYHDLPQDSKQIKDDTTTTARSIAIISSPLSKFFSPPAEGAPPPAAAVITFPTGSLSPRYTDSLEDHPPIYLMIHSSDTGECPAGQSKYTSSLPSQQNPRKKISHDDPRKRILVYIA